MQMIANELKSLGFTEKEALVYLAGLALGPSAVQVISRESGVNRATTYVIIEQLSKRGLFASSKRGKKRYFSAAHPDRIVEWIESEMRMLQERFEKMQGIIGDLKTLAPAGSEAMAVQTDEAIGEATIA